MSSTRSSARLLAAPIALIAASAWGALPDEIQVYTDDLENPGEHGVELHVNTTPSGRSRPDYPGEVAPRHGLRITPEISWGLARGWDAGLYLPLVRSGEGSDYFAGAKFRLKWLPLRPAEGSAGYFAGVNGELAFVHRRFEEARRTVEIRPIIGYRGTQWLFAFNPIVNADLAGTEKGVLKLDPAFKISRAVGESRALGVEYYSELGRLSRFSLGSQQSHALYFTIDTKDVNFGIGRGLNGATDRWTIKSIISF